MSSSHTQEQLNEYFKKRGGYRTKSEREEFWDEDKLQSQVCTYLRENHPNLVFFSDMSGASLSKRQAVKFAGQRAEGFKVPDMIFVGENGRPDLYLELKKLDVTLYTKTGKFVSNEHLQAQACSLKRLRLAGKVADFSIGYVETISKINQWLEKGTFEYRLK